MNNSEQSRLKRRIKSKNYYEKNKYRLCNNKLNFYSFYAIEQIQENCKETVNEYFERYPFEMYAENYILKELYKKNIYSTQDKYADCYDAGMIAYLYSICRCAYMKYNHTEAYIKKMVRVYIICALVVYTDTYNLCRENGFQEVRLDAHASINCC